DSTRTDSGAWRLVATRAPQAVQVGDQRLRPGIVRLEPEHLARGVPRLVEVAHLEREPGQLVPAGAYVGEAGQHLALDLLRACQVAAQRCGGGPLSHDARAGLHLGELAERRRRLFEAPEVGEPPAEIIPRPGPLRLGARRRLAHERADPVEAAVDVALV